MGGDFFPREEAILAEQMTIWTKTKESKNSVPQWIPKQHDPSVQMWREFSSLVADSNQKESYEPGVVRWISELKRIHLYDEDLTILRSTTIGYKQKDGVVTDVSSDTLTFHADLLTEIGKRWQARIVQEIENCEKTAQLLGYMAKELAVAAGDKNDGADKKARGQFYFAIDVPFRQWLQEIDPHADAAQDNEVIENWRRQAKCLARQQAKEMAQKAGNAAFIGRTVKMKEKGIEKAYHYSAPEAYNHFLHQLNEIYKTI